MSEPVTERPATTLRRFKPYPKYKDSGVEWLGEIPEHWEVKPVRSLARPGYKTFTDGDWIESPFIRDEGIRLIQTGNIGIGAYREQGFRYIDDETFRSFRCTEVLPGDVLICRLADPVGRACLAPDLGCRMITSVDVCILKTTADIDPGFLVYALSGREYLSWLSSICRGGTRDRISRSMLASIRVQTPPLEEQGAITAFLDWETARIDALVAKKERLIELLQEKRAALITRVVTKGLDPNVPMKDSGLEWLGEIPAHWKVVPLKRLLTRCDYGISDSLAGTGDIRVLTMAHIQEGAVLLPQTGSIVEVPDELFLDQHDLLFNRTNSRDLVGKVGIFTGSRSDRVTFASYLVRMTAQGDVSPTYLNFILNSSGVLALARSMAMLSVNQANLNPTRYTQIELPLPPLREQNRIVGHLDRERARTTALMAKVRDAIARLEEFRTALISAAVTGKIDVRDEAA